MHYSDLCLFDINTCIVEVYVVIIIILITLLISLSPHLKQFSIV